ncbi:MAG: PIN domain-containing protein [Gemmatimonadota bacterium]
MNERARFADLVRKQSLLHLDASVLALHLAGIPASLSLTRTLFRLMEEGEVEAQTSALSLYQLLMESYRRNEESTSERIERLIGAIPGLKVIPLDGRIARQAAQVRARIGGRLERSVQLATALSEDADLFLTRHSSLRRVAGMGIESLDAYTGHTAAAP